MRLHVTFSAFGLQRCRGQTDLQVSKLSKLFAAILELAGKRLSLLMYDAMSPDIAPLGEAFPARITRKGTLPSVTTFMCLLAIKKENSLSFRVSLHTFKFPNCEKR